MSDKATAKYVWNIFFKGPQKFKEHIQVQSDDAEAMDEARSKTIVALEAMGAEPETFTPRYSGQTGSNPMAKAAEEVLGPPNGGVSKLCGRCGGGMTYKTGKKKPPKTGNWQGWFCQAERDHVEWISD